MKFGFVSTYSSARDFAEMAQTAEAAGWDAIFAWEPVWGLDAWMCMTAAAMLTQRIRLGTMISPISRMRPWDLAGKATTLDQLSDGRVTISVGLGAVDTGFTQFGEVTDRKTRAELIDEGLDILQGLWKGQPFSYEGKHYHIKETTFPPAPPPVQQPRIPIWMVGAWGSEKSMRRVLRCDGLLPQKVVRAKNGENSFPELKPADLREMKAWVEANRTETTPFDYVIEAPHSGDPTKSSELAAQWKEAGATWWIESIWDAPAGEAGKRKVLDRIKLGPPKR